MKETNPVEQRIEALAEKWNDAKETSKDTRIIRILAKEKEASMVDAFFWYMVGLDNLIEDIAFILDPPFTDVETYSHHLLQSLESCIKEWNETPKEEGIDFVPITWTPEWQVTNKYNAARLFVSNFNRLAQSFDLADGIYAVAILPFPHDPLKAQEIYSWLELSVKAYISSKVRFLIVDTEEQPLFRKLAAKYNDIVYTLIPEMDMDNLMSQVAAMGDPTDPSTPYRIAFANMMNAMGKDNTKEAQKEGETCIRIATENTTSDPNWGIQTVVVYLALANDQLKTKNYEKAHQYTAQAIEAADTLTDKVDPTVAFSVSAQACMTKAAIFCYPKDWEKAIPFYVQAAEKYEKANNPIMAIEAWRMAGFCSAKVWGEHTVDYLVKGFLLGEGVDKESLKASAYSVLIRQLLDKRYREYISYEEIDRIASSIYGAGWEEAINRQWKESPDAPTPEAVL